MDQTVKEIIESIARYLYAKIHENIAAEVQSRNPPNLYGTYTYSIIQFGDLFASPATGVTELSNIYDFHINRVKNSVLSFNDFVLRFAEQYTFENKQESKAAQLAKTLTIIKLVILRYSEYLQVKDTYSYFGSVISPELKIELKEKISKFIRQEGTIYQYGTGSKNKSTVPRKLYDRLINKAEKKGIELY